VYIIIHVYINRVVAGSNTLHSVIVTWFVVISPG